MEVKSILAIICAAIALVGGIETVYQIYQLTVIDATIRGLKHPKLWGLLASNGNNSSGLLLYLIGRRNYPINSIDSNQKTKMIQRKKAAGISLCFMVVGILGLIFKYKFIIFGTHLLTVLKSRAIMYLEIRKGINKEPSFKS